MKIIIIHPDPVVQKALKEQIAELNHVVLDTSSNLSLFLSPVVKYQPDVVLAQDPGADLAQRYVDVIRDLGLNLTLVWIPKELQGEKLTDWISTIFKNLPNIPGSKPLVPYSAGSRTVIHDEAYRKFASDTKHNIPALEESAQDRLPNEMAQFGRQVERAIIFHNQAHHYLRQVLSTDRGLRMEVAYRAVHSSYKSYWLREHVYRWVGVLAHYIPGVEINYLPPPSPPSPRIDFLHYTPPAESFYTAAALLMHGFKPSWTTSLQSVLGKFFTGQPEEVLQEDVTFLLGWSTLLREIAIAQVRVMAHALNSKASWYEDGLLPRSIHRATGIYLDFWHWRHLRQNPSLLRRVADGVVMDRASVPPEGFSLPLFRQFLAMLDSTHSEHVTREPDETAATRPKCQEQS